MQSAKSWGGGDRGGKELVWCKIGVSKQETAQKPFQYPVLKWKSFWKVSGSPQPLKFVLFYQMLLKIV